ncbi:sulfotransferase family protein [Phenylobacterium sp. J426]|uniref:sulfotransferase family protein n=1 Tax=Phenylobacterium sp. J426 TaxID=2898439 RepID=UPI002150E1BE|nr:sulfotransferase family protein [Phenylobacterium sp. J426]MCR5876526.1 sulfotransferase family protein [Phenylobacterium sp. J426]
MLGQARRFLFVHVPKTGGNSVQNVLRAYSEDEIVCREPHQDGLERFELVTPGFGFSKHSPLSAYRTELPLEVYRSLFKFACVRNPWERAISFYFSPHRGVTSFSKVDFMTFLETAPPMVEHLRDAPDQALADIPSNFEAIMRFERLQADFDSVCERLGLPRAALPVRNRSTRQSAMSYYDAETLEAVRRRFAEDIALFGYDAPSTEA